MMDSVNEDVITEPINTLSNFDVTNLVVETSTMSHRGWEYSNAFDYGSVSEVDCEVDFIECETVGMYALN